MKKVVTLVIWIFAILVGGIYMVSPLREWYEMP